MRPDIRPGGIFPEVASNTALTQQVYDLTRQIHDFLTAGTP